MLGKASEIKVKFLDADFLFGTPTSLDVQIRRFTEESPDLMLVDIRIQTTMNGAYHTATIIYKKHIEFTNPFEEV